MPPEQPTSNPRKLSVFSEAATRAAKLLLISLRFLIGKRAAGTTPSEAS
jgi:hypothetical protein